MGNNQTSEQTMNSITIKNVFANKTEAEIDAAIDEAIAEAVLIGVIVPTGETEWSERRQRLIL
jgi:1,4-dihydroxy-2-naphthoyl-CoA synthase